MNNSATSNILWTSLGLVGPLSARVSGSIPRGGVTGISIDTRTLQKGDLFFAIKGANSDGHDFVGAAFDNGAAAAVVDEHHALGLKRFGPFFVATELISRSKAAAFSCSASGSLVIHSGHQCRFNQWERGGL